jgi:hypothetical protein
MHSGGAFWQQNYFPYSKSVFPFRTEVAQLGFYFQLFREVKNISKLKAPIKPSTY